MIDNKIKILTVASIVLAVVVIYIMINGLSSAAMQTWYKTSISKMTVGDIFILVILHAILNRSEIKK